MIDKLKAKHPVQILCNQLNVAVSGYFAYFNGKQPSPRKLEDLRITVKIKAAHERGRGIYGASKVQSELKAVAVTIGVKRIKRLRKLANIKCIHKRKFRVTTDSKHKLPTRCVLAQETNRRSHASGVLKPHQTTRINQQSNSC